ncbi:cation:proton antiporter [Desulfospira joergensenii]|uniref:cation:proton antiporter domain-containing protein n=1 Tax=Desulfospira joergensenii TaxID=53329 RepID=UPI0003B5030D|nr:cation:proton antiporter [Desulfospira joergensenii]
MEIAAFAAGFVRIALASRQMGQELAKTGLPRISIFLFTGILTGPYVLGLISKPAIEHLRFIDEISLGFIAFAAGAELYLKEIRSRINSILSVTTGLVVSTFCLTSLTLFLVSGFVPFMADMSIQGKVSVSLLAGAILVARSPSSAIAIANELRAKGPFTQTVLGVTVIMDVIVILLFSANSSVVDALLSGLAFNFGFLILLVFEIIVWVFMGYALSRVLLLILLFLP